MANPVITFRLTPYQLARGLQIVRELEPEYQLHSLSQLVKVIYTDYLAKMTLGQGDDVEPEILAEIQSFVNIKPSKRKLNLSDVISLENPESFQPAEAEPTQPDDDKSKISTVSDFSPPKNWMD